MRTKQLGFTIAELLMVIWALGVMAFGGFMLYALVHFISKFW
jgi:Tfp pilus assembly protein PilE